MPAPGQDCGLSRVDHIVSYDAAGIWNPNVYRGIVGALTVGQVGGAVWEGSESRFGKTMWQGIDSQIIAGLSAEAAKYIFTRTRPNTVDNPCLWFQGGSNHSFPSGEAAFSAALVTPYMLEYASEYPAAYALLLLPLYVGAGRIKNQAHWQTDVVAGWAVGGAIRLVRPQPRYADHDRVAAARIPGRIQDAVLSRPPGWLNHASTCCRG